MGTRFVANSEQKQGKSFLGARTCYFTPVISVICGAASCSVRYGRTFHDDKIVKDVLSVHVGFLPWIFKQDWQVDEAAEPVDYTFFWCRVGKF